MLSKEMNYDATPRLSTYGLMELDNFNSLGENKIMAFFCMPHYEMNLSEYMKKLQGLNKIEKIIDTTLKLVCIFKYTHCAKRTFNDLKLENVMVDTLERESET